MKQESRQQNIKSTAFNELKKRLNLGSHRVQRNRTTSSGYISKYVILPKLWVDANHIEVGDELEFMMERNGTLSVRKSSGAIT